MKTPVLLSIVVVGASLVLAHLFICHEIHANEGGDIQASLHEILKSQYMIQDFARFSEAEEGILSGYTKNNPFEVLTYLCRNAINLEDAVPRFYHKIFLACESV